jgi:SAM-dependent methyltransferase
MKNNGIKRGLLNIHSFTKTFGIDGIVFLRSMQNLGNYFSDLRELKRQRGNDKSFPFGKRYPVLNERTEEAGTMSGHYFHQDLLVASLVYKANPLRHIDIGSRIDGFVAHVAVFRKVEIIDIREQQSKLENISFRKADLMKLPEDLSNCCDSVSSLHAIEHFGLGRYGDPIDYLGHEKAIKNIAKMLKTGGTFYFSVPVGPQRIEFNAQRVFSLRYLLDLFKTDFKLIHFSYVDDAGDLHTNVEMSEKDVESNFGCEYGCGIFVLGKIS